MSQIYGLVTHSTAIMTAQHLRGSFERPRIVINVPQSQIIIAIKGQCSQDGSTGGSGEPHPHPRKTRENVLSLIVRYRRKSSVFEFRLSQAACPLTKSWIRLSSWETHSLLAPLKGCGV